MDCGQKQVTSNPDQFVNFGAVQMIYRGNGSAQIRGRVTGHITCFRDSSRCSRLTRVTPSA